MQISPLAVLSASTYCQFGEIDSATEFQLGNIVKEADFTRRIMKVVDEIDNRTRNVLKTGVESSRDGVWTLRNILENEAAVSISEGGSNNNA